MVDHVNMKMISFADLSKQVHLIKDMILSDMIYGNEDFAEESLSFSKHLFSTKFWFMRVSWANKKRYLFALLEDVRSAWTLSLLLKSIWNCRPKDAVSSICERRKWTAYDQVPMDHNRTSLPMGILAQVMSNERRWFLSLDSESQALVLCELLAVSGGPIMWEVLRRAQNLYEISRESQLQSIQECTVIEPKTQKPDIQKDVKAGESTASGTQTISQAQRDLEIHLANWNQTIKQMRDTLKLEEFEMTLKDGTKKKVWKVNRPRPEAVETVDFLQLLPSTIAKRIIAYLPRAHIMDYARVNKYWAFLVEEFKLEIAARHKIEADLEKMKDLMFRHDTSMDVLTQGDYRYPPASSMVTSLAPSIKIMMVQQPSMKASEKSAGAFSFRHMEEKLARGARTSVQKPLRNLAEVTTRLEHRGAADENIWAWCEKLYSRIRRGKGRKSEEGIMALNNMHFPCPMMKQTVHVPLLDPLCEDPTKNTAAKPKRNISNAMLFETAKDHNAKRYSLWSRNFASLYPVFKIPSYQSPI